MDTELSGSIIVELANSVMFLQRMTPAFSTKGNETASPNAYRSRLGDELSLSAPSMVSFLVSRYFLPLSTSRSRTKYSDKKTRSTESYNFPFRELLPKDSFSWCPDVVDFLPHVLRV